MTNKHYDKLQSNNHDEEFQFPNKTLDKTSPRSIIWIIQHFFQDNRLLFVHIALLLAQVLWGGMTVWGKGALLLGLDTSLFVIIRIGSSAVIFHVMAMTFNRKEYFKKPSRSECLKILQVSIFHALSAGLYSYGLSLSTATNSVILEQATIIWTSILTIAIGREKISFLKVVGIVFGASGGFIMAEIEKLSFFSSGGANNNASFLVAIGNVLLITQGVTFSLYTVTGESLFRRMPALVVHSWVNTISVILYTVFAFIALGNPFIHSPFNLPITAWVSIAYAVFVGNVLAYQLYSWGLQYGSALTASVYFPFQALSGMLLAYFFLGEHFTWRVLAGGAFVFMGLASIVYSQRQEDSKKNSSSPNPAITSAVDYSKLSYDGDEEASCVFVPSDDGNIDEAKQKDSDENWVELQVHQKDNQHPL